jgi:hypothetical protein
MTVTPMRSAGAGGRFEPGVAEGRSERFGAAAENSKELRPTGIGPT